MNRMRLTTLIAICLCAIAAIAQQRTAVLEEIIAEPTLAGGVYHPYPVSTSENTAPPKGYEPFYVSHFSRHGSRYLISDNDLQWVVDKMSDADAAGALTPLGKDVLGRLNAFAIEMDGRGGELTPLGERQHRGIAGRMIAAYPQAFAEGAEVTAVSTPVMRCAYSMMAFVEALKEKNPTLKIPRESSERVRRYLNHHSDSSNHFNRHNGPTRIRLAKFKDERTRPDRLMQSLFADSIYLRDNVDPSALMWGLYWIAVDLPNTEQDARLFDIFTSEELYRLWQVFNYDFYLHNAAYPKAQGMHLDNADLLLADIVDTADKYVAEGKRGATLRFAHDGNIVPLLARMRVPGSHGEATDPLEVENVWRSYEVAPMAANVQLVFFRNRKNPADVLVKVMVNERETLLDGLGSDTAPFYRWSELQPFLRNILATPARDFSTYKEEKQ